ncbi:hypothetical protein [Treponema sp.]|uniref:hypothetical protein n=1 Tax=Treponema sp. TaxID=166 RepID=UPI003FD7A38D
MAKCFRIITAGANEYKIASVLSAKISELGEYECTVWEEKKDFNSNKATMSSENYIIFIGPVKEAKALYETGAIKWKYDAEGMRYGWIGKKAVLIVDSNFDFGKIINKVAKKETAKTIAAGALGFIAAGPLGFIAAGPIGAGVAIGVNSLLEKNKKNSAEVVETKKEKRNVLQCYKILVEKFLTDDLNEFMGE